MTEVVPFWLIVMAAIGATTLFVVLIKVSLFVCDYMQAQIVLSRKHTRSEDENGH